MTKKKPNARRFGGKIIRKASTAAAMAPGRSQLKQLSLLSLIGGDGGLNEQDQVEGDEMECILSQDFFCTPDYVTPEGPQILNNFEANKENLTCPPSPEKTTNPRSRGLKQVISLESIPCASLYEQQSLLDDLSNEINPESGSCKKRNYVPKSAVSLRCRVMPPPCIKNPYSKDSSLMDMSIFGDKRSKISGNFSQFTSGGSISRYREDFHEIEQVGCGNFSRVFKCIKRIDGCMYAVKQSIRQLRQDTIRRRALMEVQALASLGPHENIVGYYSSWFENEQLYIQMELCDRCLSINKSLVPSIEEILKALYQIAKALEFMHERGIAHLDVKPDNIYIKNGVYKIGDFGCATLIDRSLPIEEGDSRYLPMEIINDHYEYLDKVDIFSLGIATYELLRGSPLPESGQQFSNFRDGKIPALPGISMQFQNLIQSMMDPEPVKRPTARQVLEHPIFDQSLRK